ncbi:TetR/AcrR family transcriptional regulator [Actinoplanes sp. NPDC051633]|uniref:TetR/AcrR family transcriptional regulator n=1 Tax=Actinoplanes sp. NPDC051633 TaxID=3155670 RepID=UPI0034309BEE
MKAYHHGDLRRALLASAAAAIEEDGVAKLSLRDLARRAGVSHAAPAHHFGDKAGLLTALAVEGYSRLGEALSQAHSFLDAGVAYVLFAVENRAHFEVMFRPELYHADDPALVEAQARSGAALYAGAEQMPDAAADPGLVRSTALAGWSIAHGFATLWLSGALPDMGTSVEDAARTVLRRLNS